MKKTVLTIFTILGLVFFSSNSFAFSVSVGLPMNHTFSDSNVAESDGTSGYLIGVLLPFLIGLGMDSYKTKIKSSSPIDLATNMYNIYYKFPIPLLNFVIGLGTGNNKLECSGCDDTYKQGSATQWYTSIGMPIIPFFDIHFSYRSITSKNVTVKSNDSKLDLSGNVTGVGIAFNF